MNDDKFPKKPPEMPDDFYAACLSVKSKRPRTVIKHIIEFGSINTEELSDLYHYDHPPRAIRDVRENGIPLETYKVQSTKKNGKIAAYRFADPTSMVSGRVGGRKAFSKKFKDRLVEHYGSKSMLTNETLEARYLQIDHRIPYEISGNDAGESIDSHMLLDASAQRAKSWSCENCENFKIIKDVEICSKCFWAYPEEYSHVAMKEERRLDLVWSGVEVTAYEELKEKALKNDLSMQDFLKNILTDKLSAK